jgi:hypothetical protein
MVALFVSIFVPSFYIALTMYNPELIPLTMVLQLAATREGIPLPIVMEALLMELMVELVREAGNRMPHQMGQSYTIVGGLVIGDIAVNAGIVSPMMVVAVGLTALGAFAIQLRSRICHPNDTLSHVDCNVVVWNHWNFGVCTDFVCPSVNAEILWRTILNTICTNECSGLERHAGSTPCSGHDLPTRYVLESS